MQYILGIDIGTGSTKVVTIDQNGEVLATASRKYPILQPQPGHSEQEPDKIFNAFCDCVADVFTQLGHPPQTISMSAAMHSVIPVDAKGNALANMITWADTRAESIATAIRSSEEGEMIYRTSGTPIHPMSPLCKLIWLKDNQPDLFASVHKFISIKEYIWFKLFSVFEIDHGMASATGMFDIIHLQWSSKISDHAGIPLAKLSEPVGTTTQRSGVAPDVASKMKIPVETNFIIGTTDGCSANLGSMAIAPGTAALTIGTSGAVRVTGNKPIYDYSSMTFNYLLTDKIFVSGGAVNNGGIAINWLLSNFLDITGISTKDHEELFDRIAAVPAGSDGLIFLPYLYGDRAPIWDAKASGAYFNIKPVHGQAHFLRAAVEGVCFALNDVLKTLEGSAKINQLNVSGGFTHSDEWMQILADITGKRLVLLQQEDASAVGAAYLAMQATDSNADLPTPQDVHIVEPRKASTWVYSKTFPIFRQLYSATKAAMHQLNQ
ncbi:gluconokinase [Mucilaginibacter myungsuensis]|uniref:Gluconokinase n=1 Tax=Mucilaginibacter myungsuensis TaxID=649104 RepID=A0A929PVI1_9SPHI|nr:gluconokinase [Mucilaginibacter myungsuensis]MBE9661803.1 gluconokinase [Mucilaginibacter myungsuensis]MDN3599763.1 gluconokinase [Mucilaginibacter myungsuensis]